jgi:hypothetical protein
VLASRDLLAHSIHWHRYSTISIYGNTHF